MQYLKKKILNFSSLYIILIFFLDRITKLYILNETENLSSNEIFFSNYLNIQLVWNKGIAFGLLSIDKNSLYNLITFFIIIVITILVYLANKSESFEKFSYSLIIGGALGNLFDRVYYRAVPDFIDLHINNFHWFIFNIADIFITLGILCLIFVEIFLKREI